MFAENGINVSLQDPSKEMMDSVIQKAEKSGYHNRVSKFKGMWSFTSVDDCILRIADYRSLCKSLSTPKLFVFSLPHGNVGDKVLQGLIPHLSHGDIILDCGNEDFLNTEHRQNRCQEPGVDYIGCGVSGGYQAARAGPSMCLGGDEATLVHHAVTRGSGREG